MAVWNGKENDIENRIDTLEATQSDPPHEATHTAGKNSILDAFFNAHSQQEPEDPVSPGIRSHNMPWKGQVDSQLSVILTTLDTSKTKIGDLDTSGSNLESGTLSLLHKLRRAHGDLAKEVEGLAAMQAQSVRQVYPFCLKPRILFGFALSILRDRP